MKTSHITMRRRGEEINISLHRQELRQLMALHGGRFENYYYRDRVTHIICSNLTDAKIKAYAKERCVSACPDWVLTHLPPADDACVLMSDAQRR